MPHSFRKHDVVEHEDQGLIRPKSGTRVDGTGLLRSVCLGQGLRFPLQRVRSETGRLSFDTTQRRPKLVLKRVCRCIQRGVIPYTICGLDSPIPSSQGLIGTLGGLDGRYKSS